MIDIMDENGPLGGGSGRRLGRAAIIVASVAALAGTLMTFL